MSGVAIRELSTKLASDLRLESIDTVEDPKIDESSLARRIRTFEVDVPALSPERHSQILEKSKAWLAHLQSAAESHRLRAVSLYMRGRERLNRSSQQEPEYQPLEIVEGIEFALVAITRIIEQQLPGDRRRDSNERFVIDWSNPNHFGSWRDVPGSELSISALIIDCLIVDGRLPQEWATSIVEDVLVDMRKYVRPLPRLVRVGGSSNSKSEFRLLSRSDRTSMKTSDLEELLGFPTDELNSFLASIGIDYTDIPQPSAQLAEDPDLSRYAVQFDEAWETAIVRNLRAEVDTGQRECESDKPASLEHYSDEIVSEAVKLLFDPQTLNSSKFAVLLTWLGRIAKLNSHAARHEGHSSAAEHYDQIARVVSSLG